MKDIIPNEPRRFTPSKESLLYMRTFRDRFPDIQKNIPEIKGASYFGSRTIGKERISPDKPSDLDVIIFFDGTDFEVDESGFTIIDDKGKLLPNAGERVRELAEKRKNADSALNSMLSKSKQVTTALMKEIGLPIDIDEETGQNKTIFTIDISQTATQRAIELLKMYVDANTDPQTKRVRPDGINGVTFLVVSRFLLGIGEDLYKNRSYILNTLEEMEQNGENGEKYFRGLMDCLRGLQRTEDQQGKLPYKIEEAKSYFRGSNPVLETANS